MFLSGICKKFASGSYGSSPEIKKELAPSSLAGWRSVYGVCCGWVLGAVGAHMMGQSVKHSWRSQWSLTDRGPGPLLCPNFEEEEERRVGEHWESWGWWRAFHEHPGICYGEQERWPLKPRSVTAKVNVTAPSLVRAGKKWPLVSTTGRRVPSYTLICKHKLEFFPLFFFLNWSHIPHMFNFLVRCTW